MPDAPARSKYARDPRIWTVLGQLRDEVVRDIAGRLRAGQQYDEISAAIGIGKATGRRKCAEIGAALGMPIQRTRYEMDTDEVLRRVEEEEGDHAIAAALGRTIESVRCIRRKHGIHRFTQLRISAEETEEIERRLIAGESTRRVAAAVGCQQADVQRRLQRIAHLIPADRPLCECGRPRNHGGRCNSTIDPQIIREQLLAGRTTADIARQVDRTAPSFRKRYVQPVIDQLTREGYRCACGQPFGHQMACSATMATLRLSFTSEQRARATDLVRDGAAVSRLVAELGLSTYGANVIAREIRSTLAAEGVLCPCGQPLDHNRLCSARNGKSKDRGRFQFACAAATNMPPADRRKVSSLAREGWPISVIVRRTGQSEWRVTQMVQELDRAGHLPLKCAGCDLPRGHKASCPKPKLCQCGRPRNHRGPCRRADGRRRIPFTKLPPEKVAEVKRRYHNREGIRSISRSTGVIFRTVQRLVNHWHTNSKRVQAPCPCGRPLRHGGSCWATKNGVVGKRHLTRIEDGMRAGRTSYEIAQQLKLTVATVLKHAVPIRDRLFAEGHCCACGRPLNHNHWCSARWDAHEMPRGRRPFPDEQEKQAVEALLLGDLVADIAELIGVGPGSIWRLRRSLSEGQRTVRAKAMRERLTRSDALRGEDLMTKIKSAVSKRIDPVLRDDVISELYLAVIEGRVEVEQIGAVVRSFVSRGMAQWQSAYGPRSLDAKIGDDGNRTLGDLVSDDTASGFIDDIQIGRGA